MNRSVSVVFVVDDEELITRSLALILGRAGFAVFPFTNPLEAAERIVIHAPDLLISDIMMPQLSGIELAILARESVPACRILLFSAAAADLSKQVAEKGHDFRLLQKPVHPTVLLQEIELLELGGRYAHAAAQAMAPAASF